MAISGKTLSHVSKGKIKMDTCDVRPLSIAHMNELQRAYDRQRLEPSTLLSLGRHDEACRLIFKGLHDHYLECVTTGRMDKWEEVGIASIRLLAAVPVKPEKRTDQ